MAVFIQHTSDLPEILTVGRERQLFDWLFQQKSARLDRVPQANRNHYVEAYARPGAMSRGFAYYRVVAQSARQNKVIQQNEVADARACTGGSSATGDRLQSAVEPLALHVEGGAIKDCGHYVMEEQPEIVAEQLLRFFNKVGVRS